MNENHPTPSNAPAAHQWEPPRRRPTPDGAFAEPEDVQSATECTGLAARPPETRAAAAALSDLYALHEMKPLGNIGKDNPNNPPEERDFHRS